MGTARLTTALLLAAALAACGSSDTNDPTGSGGVGGTGGSGGSVPPLECSGQPVVELDGATSPAIYEGVLGEADSWVATCTPEDSVGYDVVVHFTAGEAGFYRFSTDGTSFDTLLSARTDCEDGFTEIACNDDRGASKQSQISMQLEAGQQVFVLVDSVNVRQAEPFKLLAEKVNAQAPVIEDIAAFGNRSVGSTGVRFSGTNPDSPIVGYELQVFGASGSAIFSDPLVARFDDPRYPFWTVKQENGTFEIEGSFVVNSPTAIARVEMVVVDELDQKSAPKSAPTRDPQVLERHAACDPAQALNVCGPNDACVMRPPATAYTCEIATAPTLSTAVANVNRERKLWGIVVTGTDPEADVAYARVLPRDAQGTGVAVGESGRTVVPYYHLGQDPSGAYRGVVLLPAQFDGPCLAPANAYLQSCIQRGGNQQTCYNEAVAQLLACYDEAFASIVSVDVEVVDSTGRVSAMIPVDLAPSAAADLGAECDPYGVTGICPDGAICWSETTLEAEICQEQGPASCPAEYGVIDLLGHASGESWVYQGSNADGAVEGGGSCGGGGPTDVFSFTAPDADTYSFATSQLGTNVDTVLYLRNFCQLPAYELTCNDDFVAGRSSRVTAALEAGETIFVFVDSVDGTATGSYKLTVSRM